MTRPGPPVRIGILRPSRPARLGGDIEARVIRAELARRLGEITLDLRVDGDAIGSWGSRSTAAWPGDIDVELDAALLWGDGVPSLCSIFGRTLDDTAIDVRRRMLTHLGVGGAPIGDELLGDEIPWRPTDAWLLAERDGVADDASADLRALADRSADTARALDDAFDAAAAVVAAALGEPRHEVLVARLLARIAELERAAGSLTDEVTRERVETSARLDTLAAEAAVLDERRARGELDGAR